jgi:hypothetical protein
MAYAQVAGFSPVNAIFDVFRPVSQPEGIDFSPVIQICPEIFFHEEFQAQQSRLN